MRDSKPVGMRAIPRHQKSACKPLVDFMKPDARGGCGELRRQDKHVPIYNPPQRWTAAEYSPKGRRADASSTPGALHQCVQRCRRHSQGYVYTQLFFASHHPDFEYGSSVPQRHE